MDQAVSTRSPNRRRAVMVAGGVAVLAAIGAAGWLLDSRADSSVFAGPGLSIEVVAPVEPVALPGGVLEVGTLNDGFDRAALDRQAEPAVSDPLPPDAYVGEDWMPLDAPVAASYPLAGTAAPATEVRITSTDPLADGSRLFGFDRPTRDEGSVRVTTSAPAEATAREPGRRSEDFFE